MWFIDRNNELKWNSYNVKYLEIIKLCYYIVQIVLSYIMSVFCMTWRKCIFDMLDQNMYRS